jgi:hypothetical protein
MDNILYWYSIVLNNSYLILTFYGTNINLDQNSLRKYFLPMPMYPCPYDILIFPLKPLTCPSDLVLCTVDRI